MNPTQYYIGIGGLANAFGPLLSEQSQSILSTSKLSPEQGAILFYKQHEQIEEI